MPSAPAQPGSAGPSPAPFGSPHTPFDSSPREVRSLHRRGQWSLRCDGDEITEIARDGVVLLESLRPALRDSQWDTITPRITESRWDEDPHSLRRTQTLHYEDGPSRATATAELEVTAEALRCRFTLSSTTELSINRAGLTAMLPRTFAGLDALVRTPGGAERTVRFPRRVSPFQPLFDIRTLEVEQAGIRCRLDFSGDTFEMEDQRNWTDASFKIYSRPLVLPFPYQLRAGELVTQEVVVTALPHAAHPHLARRGSRLPSPVDVGPLLRAAPHRFLPEIGTGATTQFSAATAAAAGRPFTERGATGVGSTGMKETAGIGGLGHLLVEIADHFPHAQVLGSAAAEAKALGVPVDLRIIATPQTDLSAILIAADSAGISLARVCVVDAARHVTTALLWERLREATSGRSLELVAGARSHFTEFNREIHEIPLDADSFTFPSTPQMHMRETCHVIASIAALGDVLDSAAALRPGRPLHLGPVTLRPRVNAVTTHPELVDRCDAEGYGAHLVPGATDPRQHSTWAAAWAGAVILHAAAAGVSSVTIAEHGGPRGLLLPEGGPAPVGEIVALFGSLSGSSAQIVNDVAGPGTALARCGDRLVAVNARLEDWSFHLSPAGPGEGAAPLLIPAGSYRVLTLPPAALPPADLPDQGSGGAA